MNRLLAAGLLLVACGGERTGPVIEPPPPPPPPPPAPPPPPPAPVPTPMFSTPIAGVMGETFFYGSYRDDGATDYHCGFKWYAGHRGVDILLRNFRVMDSGVAVLAAAPGAVVEVRNDVPDRSTVNGNGGFGNHVLIDHEPTHALVYYGHMRKGSIRVALNQVVQRGDTLGLVGSSGNSNWPHLHFEVSDAGAVIDPFLGPCNPPVTQSTWLSQPPWQGDFAVLDAGISRIALSWAELLERPPDDTLFTPADGQVTLWANLFNIQTNATHTVLLDPTGAVLGQVSTGPYVTFSTTFLEATFNTSGLLTTAGRYSIALSIESDTGDLIEVGRRMFTFDPAASPGPLRSPRRAPPLTHTVWIGPDAGDR